MPKILIITGEVPIPDSLSGQAKVHSKLEAPLEALRKAIVDAGGKLDDRVATKKEAKPALPPVTPATEPETPPAAAAEQPRGHTGHRSGTQPAT